MRLIILTQEFHYFHFIFRVSGIDLTVANSVVCYSGACPGVRSHYLGKVDNARTLQRTSGLMNLQRRYTAS